MTSCLFPWWTVVYSYTSPPPTEVKSFVWELILIEKVSKKMTEVARGYKKSCSTQLSMNFFLLINVKTPSIDGILTVF